MSQTMFTAEAADIDGSVTQLRALTGDRCIPSIDSISRFRAADVVLVSGQFFAAGKSTIISAIEKDGRINVASHTNRPLRSGEVEGIDKCQRSLSAMTQAAILGSFLELEEMRSGCFYATPAEFAPGQRYVKDVDLKGALRLRAYAPEVPIVIPLPPITAVPRRGVTEWERRVVVRENLARSIDNNAFTDLQGRLQGVITETDRIFSQDVLAEPCTFLVINDHLPSVLRAVTTFLQTGKKTEQIGLSKHLMQLRSLANMALHAA